MFDSHCVTKKVLLKILTDSGNPRGGVKYIFAVIINRAAPK